MKEPISLYRIGKGIGRAMDEFFTTIVHADLTYLLLIAAGLTVVIFAVHLIVWVFIELREGFKKDPVKTVIALAITVTVIPLSIVQMNYRIFW
jgi:hypothetical protein